MTKLGEMPPQVSLIFYGSQTPSHHAIYGGVLCYPRGVLRAGLGGLAPGGGNSRQIPAHQLLLRCLICDPKVGRSEDHPCEDLTEAHVCTIPVTVDISVNSRMTRAIQKVQNCCGLRRSLQSWAQLTGGDWKMTSYTSSSRSCK